MLTSSARRAPPRSSGFSFWRRRDCRMASVAATPTSARMRASSTSSQASSSSLPLDMMAPRRSPSAVRLRVRLRRNRVATLGLASGGAGGAGGGASTTSAGGAAGLGGGGGGGGGGRGGLGRCFGRRLGRGPRGCRGRGDDGRGTAAHQQGQANGEREQDGRTHDEQDDECHRTRLISSASPTT